MVNPVYFYLWTHSEIEELKTPILEQLVRQADCIFLEDVSSDLAITTEIENDFNRYSQKGILAEKLRPAVSGPFPTDPAGAFLLNLTKGTTKRYVFEKTLEADFDYNGERDLSTFAFFKYHLGQALKIKQEFLQKSERYQQVRERDVAEQIVVIPETTLVLFGAAHQDLAEIVSRKRPTITHYPYPDYPLSYETKMMQAFRQTGSIDKELYLRCVMESIAEKALKGMFRESSITTLIANRYATILTPDQIADYSDYASTCSRLVISIDHSITQHTVFLSYLLRKSLPLPADIFQQVFPQEGAKRREE